ncbi:LCP family protein [Longispora sp. NPDC051575]|uniref:LCP family protein n=1 Tax=Longispora sp. NPDC051575 TaxID=3154943 RepID=UPI0034176AA8
MTTLDKPGVHRRRRSPLWARLCLIFGCVLTLVSGIALIGGQALVSRYTSSIPQISVLGKDQARRDVKGPINILLVGIDKRRNDEPGSLVRADTVMWAHIPAAHDRAYLLSLPRDLDVPIPAHKPSGYQGTTGDKLNAAFAFGAGEKQDLASGLQLLMKTVQGFTGVKFDLVGMIDWYGFTGITHELGGVTMCLDKGFKSTQPGFTGYSFPAGCNHYNEHTALALVRQRYDLPGGDYDRQKLQQQFVMQILKQALSKDVVSNPVKLDKIIRSVGASLQLDLGGYDFLDLVFALRNIKPTDIITMQIPHATKKKNGADYEELVQPLGTELFQGLIKGQVDDVLIKHPELATKVQT